VLNYTQLTNDGMEKVGVYSAGMVPPPIVTDGSRLYFSERPGGANSVIGQVSVTGGNTLLVPAPFHNTAVVGVSPSGSDLLVYTWIAVEADVPLWVVPVLGGSPRRVGSGQDASWSQNEDQIVYARIHDLYVSKPDGSQLHKLVSVEGLPAWPRFSPSDDVLRFTVYDPKRDSSSLWEISPDGSHLHRLLPDWSGHAAECCGNWTSDGSYFVFQSTRKGRTDIWAVREKGTWWRKASHEPVQLTAGPMSLSLPLPSKDGRKLFALGVQQRGELVRYDARSGQFVPYLGGISATGVDFSRDGQWAAYVAYPEASLWRSKADGSQPLQLTFPPLEVDVPRWSPDGKQIVFMGREPGRGWRIYTVLSEGGSSAQEVVVADQIQAAPDWSSDGSSILFGGLPAYVSGDPKATAIYRADLKTRQISTLPGSEGLYCPRSSPDGRYVAAVTADGRKLLLFDVAARRWTELTDVVGACASWSRNGTYLYFQTLFVKDPAVFRVRTADGRRERVVGLNLRRTEGEVQWWSGLTLDDSPMLMRSEGSQEIYALDWELP